MLTSTHNSCDGPQARFEEEGGCEGTSRSGKGLRPLISVLQTEFPWFMMGCQRLASGSTCLT